MSRGYLCPIVPTQLVGEGPEITGAVILAPEISGSAQDIVPAPIIQGAAEVSPTVTTAVSDPAPPGAGTPSLTSGNELVPIISSAEED